MAAAAEPPGVELFEREEEFVNRGQLAVIDLRLDTAFVVRRFGMASDGAWREALELARHVSWAGEGSTRARAID